MSESSDLYGKWYTALEEAGVVAQGMADRHGLLPGPSERLAIAQRARQTARWHLYLAETLELHHPALHDV